MDIKCSHCGTEYEIDKSEFGKCVKCEICGKRFVAGVVSPRQIGGSGFHVPINNRGSVVREQPMHKKNIGIGALFLVGVIGVAVGAGAILFVGHEKFGFMQETFSTISDMVRFKNTQEFEGIVIEKLGGEKFRKEYMYGKELYFASLPQSGGFAPNVNVFMDKCTRGLLPSLSEYVNKAVKDYEAMGCNVNIIERNYDYVTMGASGGGLTFDIKIIRDESKCRFVVVTGTMRTETAIMGARKSDKEAESIVHKIVHCVHSARL